MLFGLGLGGRGFFHPSLLCCRRLYHLIVEDNVGIEMAKALDVLLAHSFDFKGQIILHLTLDNDFHAHEGIIVAEVNDVGILQTDAALTGTSRHAFLIVRASVYAYSTVARGDQTEEEIAIGLDVATAVAKIMLPSGGILYLRDGERL